jgi:hypothetical protein
VTELWGLIISRGRDFSSPPLSDWLGGPPVQPVGTRDSFHPLRGAGGVKCSGHEADYSLPSSAEVKNTWSYTSTPSYRFMAWCLTLIIWELGI